MAGAYFFMNRDHGIVEEERGNNIRNTGRQYEGPKTPLGYHTDQSPKGRIQYDGQGVM